MNLHSALIRRVDFRTKNRRRLVAFYEEVLGVRETRTSGCFSLLSGADGNELIGIEEDPGATASRGRAVGLHHIAFLLPSRTELARAAATLLDLDRELHGYVDHGVSEALYLEDPDGNGIELTWDKDASDWPLIEGKPSMRTRGLRLQELLGSEDATRRAPRHWESVARIGHVHLAVRDLDIAESLFVERLALERSPQPFPGARFFTLGPYHHYFAANQWQGPAVTNAPERQVGWVGLQSAEEFAGGAYFSRSQLVDS